MENVQLKELIARYVLGQCTQEEELWLENWYAKQGDGKELGSPEQLEKDIQQVFNRLPLDESRGKNKVNWIGIAATMVGIFIALGALIYFNQGHPTSKEVTTLLVEQDIAPKGNKTMIRFPGGEERILDELILGEEYQVQGMRFRRMGNRNVEFLTPLQLTPTAMTDSVRYEIITPEGSQYEIVLMDGTRVWMNAMSTLRFPNRFGAKSRQVELSGEAYFEVAKQTLPFYVQTRLQSIQVLGTHFNVRAYENERLTKTTLLEGSVKLHPKQGIAQSPANKEIYLKPGQQAIVKESNELAVLPVNATQSAAWTQGVFSFDGTDLKSVMGEFSRWYGVEVDFEGQVPDTKLYGEVYRDVNASQALQILTYYGLKFKIINDKGISRIEISEMNSSLNQ